MIALGGESTSQIQKLYILQRNPLGPPANLAWGDRIQSKMLELRVEVPIIFVDEEDDV